MGQNKKIAYSPIELMVLVETCAEKAGVSCERYDLMNQLGPKVLDTLGMDDIQKEGSKSSESHKIGRNAHDWLKKAQIYQETKPHQKIKISERTCRTHMNFVGVESSEEFTEKFASQIERKKESFENRPSKKVETKPDTSYRLSARYFPSLLCLVPIAVSGIIISFESFSFIYAIIITGVSLILWLLLAEWLYRAFVTNSKKYENQFFDGRKMFPTTKLLLRSDRFYSNEYKTKFSNKVKKEFGLSLPSSEMEQTNLTEAIAEINSVIAHVKGKMINHKMILNHNISYGFIRNLIGGTPFAIISSVIGVALGIVFLSIPLIILQSIFFLGFWYFFKKRETQLNNAAYPYARQLIDEYMKS